jgi:hypothetical protein
MSVDDLAHGDIADVGDDDVGALTRESLRVTPAQTACGAGHDHDLILEPHRMTPVLALSLALSLPCPGLVLAVSVPSSGGDLE